MIDCYTSFDIALLMDITHTQVMANSHIMDTGEVMALLGVSRATANRLAQSRAIPSKKVGRYNVFDRRDVEEYLAARDGGDSDA